MLHLPISVSRWIGAGGELLDNASVIVLHMVDQVRFHQHAVICNGTGDIIEGAGSGGDYAVPIAKRVFNAYLGTGGTNND